MRPPQYKKTRCEQRIEDEVEVLVSNERWNGFLPLRTRDVSAAGAFFVCEQMHGPELKSIVTLKLGARSIRGHVAHISKMKLSSGVIVRGFGIAFATPHPAWWTDEGVKKSVPPVPVSQTAGNVSPAQALFNLGMHHLQAKSYQMAEQKFGQAYRLGSEPQSQALQFVSRGHQYLSAAFWSQAREAFQKALELVPACRQAQEGLEVLEEKMKAKSVKTKPK